MNESVRVGKARYINQSWELHSRWRQESLANITKYLFALNSGGLIASLAYLAAKSEVDGVKVVIWMFFLGTLFIVLRATIDYYTSETRLKALRDDIEDFYFDKIEFEKFCEKLENNNVLRSNLLHVLGWFSGLLFFAAVAYSICII